MLHNRTMCFINIIHNNFHLLIPNSQSCPPPFPPPQPQVCSFYPWVCFCFVDMFICVIIQIPHISDIMWYLSFTFWLTSQSMIMSRSTLQMALSHSFSWLIFHYKYIVFIHIYIYNTHVYIYTHMHPVPSLHGK